MKRYPFQKETGHWKYASFGMKKETFCTLEERGGLIRGHAGASLGASGRIGLRGIAQAGNAHPANPGVPGTLVAVAWRPGAGPGSVRNPAAMNFFAM